MAQAGPQSLLQVEMAGEVQLRQHNQRLLQATGCTLLTTVEMRMTWACMGMQTMVWRRTWHKPLTTQVCLMRGIIPQHQATHRGLHTQSH